MDDTSNNKSKIDVLSDRLLRIGFVGQFSFLIFSMAFVSPDWSNPPTIIAWVSVISIFLCPVISLALNLVKIIISRRLKGALVKLILSVVELIMLVVSFYFCYLGSVWTVENLFNLFPTPITSFG